MKERQWVRRSLGIAAVATIALAACSDTQDDAGTFQEVGSAVGDTYSGDGGTRSSSGALDDADTAGIAPYAADEALAAPATLPPVAPPGPDTTEPNNFVATGVNPWVDTATDAESTFALDVDTGSYTVARRFLEEGSLPPAEAVRVEEIVNYLDYGYEDPADGPMRIGVAGASTPFTSEQDDTRLVRVAVQSHRVSDEDRKPAALTFVVDTSGSMDLENRLGLVRSSLTMLTDELRPTDTIALVEYGSTARTILPPTAVAERDTIVDAIDALVPSGSTNAEDGLRLGYEQAHAGFIEGGINRVVLASDGVANVGVTGPDQLAEQLRDDADEGIQLVTVGFGMGNYNDVLMEQLADQGDGFYAYVDDQREAERLFTQDLTATLQTIALDAKSQIVFDPAVVSEYRLLGFENRDVADEDFRNDAIDAGEIGAGHAVTALYEVRLAPGATADGTVASAHLRWEDPDDHSVTEVEQSITVADLSPTFTDAPVSLQRAAVAAYYAELLRQSPPALERGLTMTEVSQVAQSVLGAHGGDGRFDELVTLVGTAATLTP